MQSSGSMDRLERVREGAGGGGWYIPGGGAGGSPWPDHKERPPDQRSVCSTAVLYSSDNHCLASLGYWHQRADERHGNPPPR